MANAAADVGLAEERAKRLEVLVGVDIGSERDQGQAKLPQRSYLGVVNHARPRSAVDHWPLHCAGGYTRTGDEESSVVDVVTLARVRTPANVLLSLDRHNSEIWVLPLLDLANHLTTRDRSTPPNCVGVIAAVRAVTVPFDRFCHNAEDTKFDSPAANDA